MTNILDETRDALARRGLTEGAAACVTGGADGIGLAVAERLGVLGMNVALIDVETSKLSGAAARVSKAGAQDVITLPCDVSDAGQLAEAETKIADRWGGTDLLLNNAGIQPGSTMFGPLDTWLWGVINGTQVFAPRMIERGRPGMIINTGSKQGITTPPGDPCYNVSKAGVKAFTEALASELRNTEGCGLTAHLLIPGFVFTNLNRKGRTEKPAGAWTPEEMADFMIQSLARGDFYILCPDNDVTRDLDEKRMAWAIGDIIENRPALSRWHPDYADAFDAFVKGQ